MGVKRFAKWSGWALSAVAVAGAVLTFGVGRQQALGQEAAATWTEPAAAPAIPAIPTNPSDPFPLEYPRWHTLEPGEFRGYNQRASLIQRGHEVYMKYCVGCHGDFGDGNGPAAARLITKPRDFTSGIYKFRSTDSGSLPLETDLYRTIKKGLSRVSMPAFPFMPERDLVAVVEYIKTFYPKWDQERDRRQVLPVPMAPSDLKDPQRISRGRIVYTVMQCGKCHGIDGAGEGATESQYTDAWGNPQKAFNFTRGRLKGGNDPEDIYRTFHTGLRSIMPAYDNNLLMMTAADTFEQNKAMLMPGEFEKLQPFLKQFPASTAEVFAKSESERLELGERNSWDLVAYVISLRKVITTADAVLGPKPQAPAGN